MCRLTWVSGSAVRWCRSTDALCPSSSSSSWCSVFHSLPPPQPFSTCFPPRHSHALFTLAHTSVHSPAACAATPCSASRLHSVAQAPLHHRLVSLLALPLRHSLTGPPLSPRLCPPWSSWQQKLPPTPWIIHESVSVFGFDWRVLTPDLSLKSGGQHYGCPPEDRTSWTHLMSFLSSHCHLA